MVMPKFVILTVLNEKIKETSQSTSLFGKKHEKILWDFASTVLQSDQINYAIAKKETGYEIFATEKGFPVDYALFVGENLSPGLYAYCIDGMYYVARLTEDGWRESFLPLTPEELNMLSETPALLKEPEKRKVLKNAHLGSARNLNMILSAGVIIFGMFCTWMMVSLYLNAQSIQGTKNNIMHSVDNANFAYEQTIKEIKSIRDEVSLSSKTIDLYHLCKGGLINEYTLKKDGVKIIEVLTVSYATDKAKEADILQNTLKQNGYKSEMSFLENRIVLNAIKEKQHDKTK